MEGFGEDGIVAGGMDKHVLRPARVAEIDLKGQTYTCILCTSMHPEDYHVCA